MTKQKSSNTMLKVLLVLSLLILIFAVLIWVFFRINPEVKESLVNRLAGNKVNQTVIYNIDESETEETTNIAFETSGLWKTGFFILLLFIAIYVTAQVFRKKTQLGRTFSEKTPEECDKLIRANIKTHYTLHNMIAAYSHNEDKKHPRHALFYSLRPLNENEPWTSLGWWEIVMIDVCAFNPIGRRNGFYEMDPHGWEIWKARIRRGEIAERMSPSKIERGWFEDLQNYDIISESAQQAIGQQAGKSVIEGRAA